MLRPRLLELPAQRVEGFGPADLGRIEPCVQHEVGEIALLVQAAEDGADLAHHQLEHGNFFVEQEEHLLLQRAACHQIEDEHFAALSDAVNAADALLDRHGIPRHIEIDQRVAELDVAALAPGLRAQQHRHALAELDNGAILLRPAQAAVEAREIKSILRQKLGQASKRRARMHEDELLLRRVAPQEIEECCFLGPGADERPALGQCRPGRVVGMARREPRQGTRRGMRRGSGGGQEVLQREAVAGRSALGREPAHRAREVGIGRGLVRRAVHLERERVAARQLEGDDRARVADHRAAHQLAQAPGVGRPARMAGRHIGRAKLLLRLEDARLEQGEQIVELDQVILHGRRREQQQEALVERIDELPALARAVAQVMRFVDDDEIEIVRKQASGVLLPARAGDGRDDALLVPENVGIIAQRCVLRGRAGEAEFRLQLLAPLPDQRSRHQHQHALGHATQQVFLEHHAGLDRLAETDLIGEEHAAVELLEHLAHGLDLVPERLDADEMRQAEKLVEALRQAEMGEALAQPPPAAVLFRPVRRGG
jgi:hypothetical protein